MMLITGCTVSKPPIVGGDRDEQGCIGSAGYQWCEKKQQCVRAWELPHVQADNNNLLMRFNYHCQL